MDGGNQLQQQSSKKYYNDANTNNKRIRGRNAREPTAEMFPKQPSPDNCKSQAHKASPLYSDLTLLSLQ